MKLMKNLLVIILSLSLISNSYAECVKPVQRLEKGAAAPCEGFLFSPKKELRVRILAEEAKLDKKSLELKDFSIKALDKSLKLSETISDKEREKSELWRTRAVEMTKEYTKEKSNSSLNTIALILSGVALTLASAWAIKQVGR